MRGVYTASGTINSLSSAKTVILLRTASSCAAEILSVHLTNADVEIAEQWEIGLYHVTTVGSPTGTAATPAVHEIADAAADCTVLIDLSAEPTAYAANPVDIQGASNLAGYHYEPIPEERPTVPPSSGIGLKMISTPSAFKAIVQVTYREIG